MFFVFGAVGFTTGMNLRYTCQADGSSDGKTSKDLPKFLKCDGLCPIAQKLS